MADQEGHTTEEMNKNFKTIFNNKEIMVTVFTPHHMMPQNCQMQFGSNISFWQHVMVILHNLVTRQPENCEGCFLNTFSEILPTSYYLMLQFYS